jgi:transcription elongation factor S-II
MGRLRQNANKDVARLATEVVSKWKKGVEAEKAARATKQSASPSLAKSSSPTPKSVAGAKKQFEGDAEKRTYKTEKVDVKRTDSDVRDNCIGLLYNGLAFKSYEPADVVLVRAMESENAAHRVYTGGSSKYKEKIRSLFANLKTNADLRAGVMSGSITADRFVVMSQKDMLSKEKRQLDEELEKENMKNAHVPMPPTSISEDLQCPKCKQKKVSYTQAQTRSADEPITTFCRCTECDNRWKVRLHKIISIPQCLLLTNDRSINTSAFHGWLVSICAPSHDQICFLHDL